MKVCVYMLGRWYVSDDGIDWKATKKTNRKSKPVGYRESVPTAQPRRAS